MAEYAISDIHGCHKTFLQLLESIGLNLSDKLYLLGDLVDRGPDSKGVLDTIFKLIDQGFQVFCLRGNHDQMLLNACEIAEDFDTWTCNGGQAVLDNFGINHPRHIPEPYLQFLNKLPYFIDAGDYLLVHAGINFRKNYPLRDYEAMLWIRDWHKDYDPLKIDNKIIVHGHTPVSFDDTLTMLENLESRRVLDIDNGCVYSQFHGVGKGRLSAFDMTNRRIASEGNIDLP
jgi:serine/threonine protein phosphatase 1